MTKEYKMRQSGNALWFILIAIGLLGLLTVSLTRGGSSSNDTGDFEQNQIVASEILSYAKSIENAVQSLLARGCSENEISFENNTVTGYSNPDAPTDKSCHIFDSAGTGMTLERDDILISSGLQITDVQTSRTDLLFLIEAMDSTLCDQLNRISNTPVIDSTYTTPSKFIGAYPTGIVIGDSGETNSIQTGCFLDTDNTQNIFYHVLHAR